MASYNSVRTAKAQPIGSAVPWTGALTEIPAGWLICNGQELDASEYPLLRRVLKNTYGGNSTGDFPNYTGVFSLPQTNQKALADITAEHFNFTVSDTNPGADQPTFGIDTAEAFNAVNIYIGPDGDIGTPGITQAITDLNFTFTPDPDGTIERITDIAGVAPSGGPALYPNVPAQYNPAQVPTGAGINATFNIIVNSDLTYSVTRREKGEGYVEGDLLLIPGDAFSDLGGSSPANDITFTVSRTGNPLFTGRITKNSDGDALTFVPGFGINTYTIVPRKLGREHLPAHTHTGSYPTININDVGENPGRGVGVWENPQIDLYEYFSGILQYNGACVFGSFIGSTNYLGNSSIDVGNIWANSDSTRVVNNVSNPFDTGVGRYTIGSILGTRPARTHTPIRTGTDGHGIGKTWFRNINYRLRDANGNVSSARGNTDPGAANTEGTLERTKQFGYFDPTSKIPYGDQSSNINAINYDLGLPGSGNAVDFTEVMFNSAAIDFTVTERQLPSVNDVIQGHDHQGEINITFNNGSLSIPADIRVTVDPSNIIPDNVPGAFQLEVNASSPNLTCLTLIRAY